MIPGSVVDPQNTTTSRQRVDFTRICDLRLRQTFNKPINSSFQISHVCRITDTLPSGSSSCCFWVFCGSSVSSFVPASVLNVWGPAWPELWRKRGSSAESASSADVSCREERQDKFTNWVNSSPVKDARTTDWSYHVLCILTGARRVDLVDEVLANLHPFFSSLLQDLPFPCETFTTHTKYQEWNVI